MGRVNVHLFKNCPEPVLVKGQLILQQASDHDAETGPYGE